MRKRMGIFCVGLGITCLLGAVGFVLYNRWEAQNAAQITQSLLENVQTRIEQDALQESILPDDAAPDTPVEMATIQVDGYACFGILSIPALDLELPVLADWSYTKLKKAPCHYYGSCYEKNFVIAAHNYKSHFGRLSALNAGDIVIFTDVYGIAHCYEVALLETLQKEATMEMIASDFDLSLYTCTPGGGSRVTVRCERK